VFEWVAEREFDDYDDLDIRTDDHCRATDAALTKRRGPGGTA
jgi:hypothetical protein